MSSFNLLIPGRNALQSARSTLVTVNIMLTSVVLSVNKGGGLEAVGEREVDPGDGSVRRVWLLHCTCNNCLEADTDVGLHILQQVSHQHAFPSSRLLQETVGSLPGLSEGCMGHFNFGAGRHYRMF